MIQVYKDGEGCHTKYIFEADYTGNYRDEKERPMKVRFKESAIRAKNAAVVRAVGQKNVKKIDLPLFTDIEAASWAAQRILAELSYSPWRGLP